MTIRYDEKRPCLAPFAAALLWQAHTMQRDFNRKYFPAGVPASQP